MRAAVAAARSVLGAWEAAHPADGRPLRKIEAAEAWIRCPCDQHAKEARDLLPDTLDLDKDAPPDAWAFLAADAAAAAAAVAPDDAHTEMGVARAAALSVMNAAIASDAGSARRAIERELVAWAL